MIDIKLNKEKINLVSLDHLKKYAKFQQSHLKYLTGNAGEEHYKLIAYISSHFPDNTLFADIGTYLGYSALALSKNKNHQVITYDIYDNIPDDGISIKNRKNIIYKIKNCINDIQTLLQAKFIVLDVDPHDAIQEQEIFSELETHNYQGIVLLDDIKKNDEMKQFYKDIKQKKYDVTEYGHWSGSALIVFDESRFNIILE